MYIKASEEYKKLCDICNPKKDGSRFKIVINGKKYNHNDRRHIVLSANELILKYATVQYRQDACVKIFRDEIKNSGHYDNYREACRQIAAEYRRVYNEPMDAEGIEKHLYIPLLVTYTIRGKVVEQEVISFLNSNGVLAFATTDKIDYVNHVDIVMMKNDKCYAMQIKPEMWLRHDRHDEEHKNNVHGMKEFCNNYGLSYYGYIFYSGEDTDKLKFKFDIHTYMGV